MKALIRSAVCIVSLLAICSAYAGQVKPDEISSEARWAAHLDVERLMSCRLASHLLGLMRDEGELEKIEAFSEIFEFNPLKDIHSITIYGKELGKEEAVIMAKGNYDKNKLLALARTNGSYQKSEYNGLTVYAMDLDEHFFVCFYKTNTIVFSNKENLFKEALDVLEGKKESLTVGSALNGMLDLPAGTIFAAAAKGFSRLVNGDPEAMILKKADAVLVDIGECEGNVFFEATLTTKDEETAEHVRDVLKGIVALGKLLVDQEPKLEVLVRSARIEQYGNKISIRETCPADELFKLIKENK